MLGTMQRQFNERAEELIEEAKALETPFQEQLDAEDARKASEKQERDRVEAVRRQAHVDGIAIITGAVAKAAGATSDEIQALIDTTSQLAVGEAWEEFRGQAQQAKDETLRQLNGLLLVARQEEAEAAEIEETRRRQAEVARQQEERARQLEEQEAEAARRREEQQRELDAQAERMREQQAALDRQREQQERAQRERAQAVQARLDVFSAIGQPRVSRTAAELQTVFAAVRDTPCTAEFFDDRTGEAMTARSAALNDIEGHLIFAESREAEQARQARAAEQQAALDEMLLLTAQAPAFARTASLGQAVEALSTAEAKTPIEAFWGDRLDEAVEVRAALVQALRLALNEVNARLRREAEEAEALRAETQRKQAETQRAVRLQEAAPRMFVLFKALLDDIANSDAHVIFTHEAESRELIAKVEGEQE
jgi:hypothetical protein